MSVPSPQRFAHNGFIRIGEEIYPCKLSNMSSTGATLSFDGPTDLPDHFTIQLTPDGKVMRACLVTWREDSDVGVVFSQI